MTCTSPVYLHDLSMYVPCGRCTACKIAHSREWSLRLIHELDYHDEAQFVTLTYDDEHLPGDGSLSKRTLQLFFKRYRKYLCDKKIKYFASGEYGEKNGRPHYHAIILGAMDRNFRYDPKLKQNVSSVLGEIWQQGHVTVGSVTYDSCRYVCDYTFKKYTEKWNIEKYGTKQPPFQLQSQGIGESYINDNALQVLKNQNITYKGVNCGIPLYYKRKLVMSADDRLNDALSHKDDLKEHYSVSDSCDDEDYVKAWRAALDQSAKNINAREGIKGARKM